MTSRCAAGKGGAAWAQPLISIRAPHVPTRPHRDQQETTGDNGQNLTDRASQHSPAHAPLSSRPLHGGGRARCVVPCVPQDGVSNGRQGSPMTMTGRRSRPGPGQGSQALEAGLIAVAHFFTSAEVRECSLYGHHRPQRGQAAARVKLGLRDEERRRIRPPPSCRITETFPDGTQAARRAGVDPPRQAPQPPTRSTQGPIASPSPVVGVAYRVAGPWGAAGSRGSVTEGTG